MSKPKSQPVAQEQNVKVEIIKGNTDVLTVQLLNEILKVLRDINGRLK